MPVVAERTSDLKLECPQAWTTQIRNPLRDGPGAVVRHRVQVPGYPPDELGLPVRTGAALKALERHTASVKSHQPISHVADDSLKFHCGGIRLAIVRRTHGAA